MDQDGALSFPDAPRDGLDRVLGELLELANDVLTTQGRLRALLRANQIVSQQLDLPVVLQRIVDVAVELVGAQYGALGVIGPHGGLDQFIYTGMSDEEVAMFPHPPQGLGLLGVLIDDPRPIRLRHMADDPRSVGFPGTHPPMDSFLGVPVRVRNEVYGNLYLTNRSTGEFTQEDEQLVTALASTAGFAIDNARLFAETQRRQAWSAASAEITATLLSDEDGDSISLLADRVLSLSEADLVFVALPTDEPARLVVGTARGDESELWEGAAIPLEGSLSGGVLAGRQPKLVDEGDDGIYLVEGSHPLGPTMAVPLIASGRALGALVVARRVGGARFTEADLAMAADFAGQASVAMELADARADRQLILLLEDRARIARDLHDHVIQQLFATGLELQSIVGSLPPGRLGERLDEAVTHLDGAISQIRTAVFALSGRRDTLHVTVRHQIIDIVNELSAGLARTPVVGFAGPVDLAITGDLAADVIAVIRESLSNVARHADAQNVSVTAAVADGRVVLEIVDDGVGVPENSRRSGLANLRARAARRGGDFSVESAKGHTRVVWSVPFHEAEREARA